MTNIDQFESVFKAADKPRFELQDVSIRRWLIVSDLPEQQAEEFAGQVRRLSANVLNGDQADVQLMNGAAFQDAAGLIAAVNEAKPDLVCTHRGLRAKPGELPYGLGICVEALTQATSVPILLLPKPQVGAISVSNSFRRVIAITDHLAGENCLVSVATRMTADGGTLFLAHVEDQAQLQRVLHAIEKIPTIDTDTAREDIVAQLLKDPHDYVTSCRKVLQAAKLTLKVEEIVTLGHYLRDYKHLIDDHEVDLVVMNTKDDDQLAMHGLAYPLAVELAKIPLLLL